jgi:hypothetical protein
MAQNTSSSCSKLTRSGSKVTCVTSAWPVVWEQTSSYVGFGVIPPL